MSALLTVQAAVVASVAVSLIRYDVEVYGDDIGGGSGGFWTTAAMVLFAISLLLVTVAWKLVRGGRGWRAVALAVQVLVVAMGYSLHIVREWLDCDVLNSTRCFDEATSLAIERMLTIGVLVFLVWALYGSKPVRRYFSKAHPETGTPSVSPTT